MPTSRQAINIDQIIERGQLTV